MGHPPFRYCKHGLCVTGLDGLHTMCVNSRMKLDEWLKHTETTEQVFAAAIGRTQQSVNRYRNGRQTPDLRTMAKIASVTKGAVGVGDFIPGEPAKPSRKRAA